MPLESKEEPKKARAVGRSSLSSIPPINLSNIFNYKPEQKIVEVTQKSETLCDALCNSYKFVVNYGVFEPNFEWMPCEVKKKEDSSRFTKF